MPSSAHSSAAHLVNSLTADTEIARNIRRAINPRGDIEHNHRATAVHSRPARRFKTRLQAFIHPVQGIGEGADQVVLFLIHQLLHGLPYSQNDDLL